jgi:CRISPR system Cascade subunit CasE
MTATMPAASPATNQPSTTPLHLTQIRVSYEDAARLLRIRDRYDWHQHVWKGFAGIIPPRPDKGRFAKGTRPEDQERTPPDFLCRIDEVEVCYRLLVLPTALPRKPDWCPTDCFQTKVMPDAFFHHARYRFSLLANPTKKLRVDSPDGTRKKNGRRVPLGRREELVPWLERKAATGGFRFEAATLRTVPRGREYFHKAGSSGLHSAVEFQGILEVTDAPAFRATLQHGIGSAKAFGFGLLVIAPLK